MSDRYILAIDPGNEQSAFVLCGPDLKPVVFGKYENELMYMLVIDAISLVMKNHDNKLAVVIEGIENHGMPIGKTTIETIGWAYILKDRFRGLNPTFIYRSQEKMTICHHPRANDATIKQALIDRFAPNTPNYGKGSKKNPGWFYNFRADVWQAYAVAVTWHDLNEESNG